MLQKKLKFYKKNSRIMNIEKPKAFCCWSGGKDSCMALYRSLKDFEVVYLLNMISEDGEYSRSHGVKSYLIKLQSEAIEIPIIQKKSSWETYEEVFKRTVLEFKLAGITTGIFADIDLQGHRDWVERVCKDTGINPVLPLWKEDRENLIREFINLGFKAIIVSTNPRFLGDEWLGRYVDEKFINDLKVMKNIDLCGELGEYHTFVFDGPIFKKPLKIIQGEKSLKLNHWFLEIDIGGNI